MAAGCGGDEERARGPATGQLPQASTNGHWAPYEPPAGEPVSGRRIIDAAGCLACHQLGSAGRSGPGDNLGAIGERMSAAEIRRALVSPQAPMPSYRALPRAQLDVLVAYLSALRGAGPGERPCPEDADCG
jgi:mono/diheme cytochrome c family protein